MTKKDCDICKKSGKIHFRVKSINHTKWIFCCKKCWYIISKEDQYSYGGTIKSFKIQILKVIDKHSKIKKEIHLIITWLIFLLKRSRANTI